MGGGPQVHAARRWSRDSAARRRDIPAYGRAAARSCGMALILRRGSPDRTAPIRDRHVAASGRIRNRCRDIAARIRRSTVRGRCSRNPPAARRGACRSAAPASRPVAHAPGAPRPRCACSARSRSGRLRSIRSCGSSGSTGEARSPSPTDRSGATASNWACRGSWRRDGSCGPSRPPRTAPYRSTTPFHYSISGSISSILRHLFH